MSRIVCTSCTVKEEKPVKALVVRDKEGEEVPLPQGHHIEGTGNNLALVQRISKVLTNSKTHKKSITWESKPSPDYTVKEETRVIPEEQDKIFNGTKHQAEQAGWCENEFGWCCPECSGESTEEDPLFITNPCVFLEGLKK
jgi:hypothetical protein